MMRKRHSSVPVFGLIAVLGLTSTGRFAADRRTGPDHPSGNSRTPRRRFLDEAAGDRGGPPDSQCGGNAFDAAVAGQAALGVTDFPLNGVGSDAVLLVYNAADKKVYSINAEPPAPKLATIDWYAKNNGGKIPDSDGLLAGGLPGVVDAWYILLDRWGTMSFEQVLQPAIDLAENGFPLSEAAASHIAESKKILKYPTTVKIYLPNGHAPEAGEIFKNPDLARTLKKLVEAEKAESRPRGGTKR